MYNFVTDVLKQDTIVIDADDLIRNPREVMQKYCAFVGLQFDECMLDWSEDHTKAEEKPWDAWTIAWTKDVKETNGFRKQDKVQDAGIKYPQLIYDAIEENMQYYDALRAHKLQVNDPVTMA